MYNVVVASHSTTFIPSFVKINQVVKNLKKGKHTHTHTHTHHSILKRERVYFFLSLKNKVPYRTEHLAKWQPKHLGYYTGREWSFEIYFVPIGISLKLLLVVLL
jgi:hypothetical protein